MHATALRTRLLTAGGATLAAVGLAATMVVGVAVAQEPDSDNVTVTADVENAIELVAADATVSLSEVPGETATAASNLVATSNNQAGYSITVQADAAELAGTGTNTDIIAVEELSVGDLAASDTDQVQIHTQDEKSAAEGDTVPVDFSLTMPHVNADAYSVGLTFTATAN